MKGLVAAGCICLAVLSPVVASSAQASGSGPSIAYHVTLAGRLDEQVNAIAVDGNGDAYVTGYTTSPDFPQGHAMQPHLSGVQDAFVTKLDPTGAVLYSTFLGGDSYDAGTGIAVDAQGDAWITGFTRSDDFPVTSDAVQPHIGGGTCDLGQEAVPCEDAFLTELSPAGTLLYSTYFGGNNEDGANAIALDPRGEIGVTGVTESRNFPVKAAVRPTLKSGPQDVACYQSYLLSVPCADAFVTVFAPGGRSVLYSTFLGGKGSDDGLGIALDAQGSAFVTGWTQSPDFPLAHPEQKTIGSCHQGRGGPPCGDMFVTRLAAGGQHLIYSTYLGGNGFDEGHGIALDAHDDAYVAGLTTSSNFPILHPAQPPHARTRCSFDGRSTLCPDFAVVKLNAAGTRLLYSNDIGSSNWDEAHAIAVDRQGRAYVAGEGGSTYHFPLLHSIQKRPKGGASAALVVLTVNGSKAEMSALYGTETYDYFNAVAVDNRGNIYVGGGNDTANTGTKSAQPYSGTDAIVLKIALGSPSAKQLP